ncbi:DUF3037 domain-containing protein [Acidipila rosea]|uniref:DUF3037 family protein n=1 Tax=Acidipila rosea TaxID=768535 RepID=A0A4R1L1Z3_9BACT|nr:DUF3037 domain-containing protein [Acidipila rosea]TCK71985.1 hypothetical protein C7378_2609 [Acidipila rosea]
MAERRQCEFFLVRYVPDMVKNEFVNIGVLLREAGQPESTVVRFTRDWGRVRCIDPDADIAMLEAIESEVRQRLALHGQEPVPVMKVIEDSFSNSLQVTDAKGCLAESVIAELESLMRLYVEPQKRERKAQKSGRQLIHTAMRTQFERAGVWDLMRKRIAASAYTRPGDTLRIDCGYRPNGVIRMFHAVSLEGDAEMAKVLAFSVAQIREGVKRVEGAALELTAVVEPVTALREAEDEERMAQYAFAKDTMESREIRVLTTSDLGRVAETARRELRV